MLLSAAPPEVFEALKCPVCFDSLSAGDGIELNCSHVLCADCAKQCSEHGQEACPLCREPHELDPAKLRENNASWRADYGSWRSGGAKGSKGDVTAIIAPASKEKDLAAAGVDTFLTSAGCLAMASSACSSQPRTATSIGVAIVGMGRAGKIHRGVLMQRKDATIRWLVDVSPEACPPTHGARVTADLDEALSDEQVDVVIVSTPTPQHAPVIRAALRRGKHVFAEKPLCCDASEAPTLFELAAERRLLLYTAFNRRHDPQILAARERVASGMMGKVFGATLISRDYPYPTEAYLAVSGNLFKDCVVHDLDYLTWLLDDEPVALRARADTGGSARTGGMYEFSSVELTLRCGAVATLINARKADSYDHRLDIFCEHGAVQVSNTSTADGVSFAERFEASYHAQLASFLEAARDALGHGKSEGHLGPNNLSAERSALLDRLVAACERSAAADGEQVDLTRAVDEGLRVYHEKTALRVREHYAAMRRCQSVEHVRRLRERYGRLGELQMSLWEAMEQLESFVDVSDPDLTLPNLVHAFQTAESIREARLPDWLQLVGLIHDCGKMVYLRGCDEDGTSVAQQWSIVGDTWVVGCHMGDELIMGKELNGANPDRLHAERMTELGIYEEGCGLDNVLTAYGHDEYMYEVLLQNEGVTLPFEALYIIRYHSLYPWHDQGCYARLESPTDRMMKGWVKLFNQHDLYTKRDVKYSDQELAELKAYYTSLIDKFLPPVLNW